MFIITNNDYINMIGDVPSDVNAKVNWPEKI